MANKKPKYAVGNLKSKLNKLKKTDFDGHTDFTLLSAEQKLAWLSNAAEFWYLTNKNDLVFSIEDCPCKTK